MAKHITHEDRTSTWMADTAGDTWIVAADAKFSMTNAYGFSDKYYDGTIVRVEGQIKVAGAGFSAVLLEADGSKVVFGENARIDVRNANGAVQGNGDNLDIVNHGLIKAGVYGIVANNGGTIVNDGEIRGIGGILTHVQAGDGTAIRNAGLIDVSGIGVTAYGTAGEFSSVVNARGGVIRADDIGVNFGSDGASKLVNRGLIDSDSAVSGGNGVTTLVNKSEIVGDIDLGAGNDVLDLRGGTFLGQARGGAGSDIYKVSGASVDLAEEFGGGNDTVLSSGRFTLGDNFEILRLIGDRDVNGRGNGLSNIVTGNKGDNRLFGMDGMDQLSGGKGSDSLEGGAGADTFLFATGFGKDVITDFTSHSDKIDLSGWAGVDSYADLILTHMKVVGEDIVFRNGGDSLRLRNVDINELDSADFIF